MDNKFKQNQYLAGSAPLVGAALKQATSWARLQKNVLASVAQQQSREAQRLQAKYGDQDPNVNEALQRAATLTARAQGAQQQSQGLKRFLATYAQPGLFHGYVLNTDGSPAQNATVEINVRGNDNKTLSANAQEDGYFSLLLNKRNNRQHSTEKSAPYKADSADNAGSDMKFAGLLKQIAQRQLQFDAKDEFRQQGHEKSIDTSSSTASASAVAMQGVQVRVLDASGAERLNDENPPEFKDGESEFRVYVLPPVVGKV